MNHRGSFSGNDWFDRYSDAKSSPINKLGSSPLILFDAIRDARRYMTEQTGTEAYTDNLLARLFLGKIRGSRKHRSDYDPG